MGASFTKKMQPDDLAVFKKLHNNGTITIPEIAENRVRTDRKYLIVLLVMVLLLVPCLIYTLLHSDTGRYQGWDECGNICGQKNEKYDGWDCTGKDYTDKKYIEIIEAPYVECYSECPSGYSEFMNICVKDRSSPSHSFRNIRDVSDYSYTEEEQSLGGYINASAWRITLACLFSLVISMAFLYLFRVATAAMVWSILVGVVTFGFILVGFLWYGYISVKNMAVQLDDDDRLKRNDPSGGILFFAILFTVLLVILIVVMVFLTKKISLVIAVLKEAMKAVFAMPQLMFIPPLTFFVQLIIVAILVTTQFFMSSSATLHKTYLDLYTYEPNAFMTFTKIFNYWMAFWGSQIVMGFQYMVIAGAVSTWYFASNKNYLGSPILTSTSIAFKFHLGTIVFGGMVITLVAIVRSLLNSLFKNRMLRLVVDCILKPIEDFIKFLSKNAFILTAMHGKPFFKSGKRAAQIIYSNALNIATINFIGDFILFMARLLVVLLSVLFTYLILKDSPHNWLIYLIVALVSIIVASICFAVFETVIDTLFLCFCEDSLLNDGMARPYAMSRDLMEFVENSKKVFEKKK